MNAKKEILRTMKKAKYALNFKMLIKKSTPASLIRLALGLNNRNMIQFCDISITKSKDSQKSKS